MNKKKKKIENELINELVNENAVSNFFFFFLPIQELER